jgi:hypothetical protein
MSANTLSSQASEALALLQATVESAAKADVDAIAARLHAAIGTYKFGWCH